MAPIEVMTRDKQLEHIKKKLCVLKDQTILQSWEMLLELAQTYNKSFYVVNAGLVKTGKSTLYNALVGKQEIFRTGDIRTTVTNQVVEKEDMVLVDTPGINATKEDTAEAFKAYKMADVLLFLHNVCDGELQRSEVEFLQSLKALFPDAEDFWKRILFVGTNADQMEQEQVIAIQELIESQVEKVLGEKPRAFFCVESLSYIKGITENKSPLLEISGINKVTAFIDDIKHRLLSEKSALFLKKFKREKKKLIDTLRKLVENIDQKAANQRGEYSALLKDSKKITKAMELLYQLEKDGIAALEQKKKDGIPMYKMPYIFLEGSYSSGYDYKSESQAEREASRRFRSSFFDKAYRKLQSAESELRQIARRLEIYETTDNVYGWVYHEIVKELVKANEEISKKLRDIEGIAIPKINTNIQAKVNLSHKQDDHYLNNFYRYESADWYERANIRTYSTTRYETGLFGREKWVDYYSYDFYRSVDDLTKDLNDNIRNAADDLKWIYKYVYTDYIDQLKTHFTKEIKNAIRKVEDQAKKKEHEAAPIKQVLTKAAEEMKQIQELDTMISEWVPVEE